MGKVVAWKTSAAKTKAFRLDETAPVSQTPNFVPEPFALSQVKPETNIKKSFNYQPTLHQQHQSQRCGSSNPPVAASQLNSSCHLTGFQLPFSNKNQKGSLAPSSGQVGAKQMTLLASQRFHARNGGKLSVIIVVFV